MATEELDEFEVLWPEPPSPSSSPVPVQAAQASSAASARSLPVDVPGRPKAARSWRWNGHWPRDDSGDHGGGNGNAIVPPHLLLTADQWRAEAETAAWTLRVSVGPPCKRGATCATSATPCSG